MAFQQAADTAHPAVDRLDDQLRWYDLSATRKRRGYRATKGAEITVAASIPAAAGAGASTATLGVLGAVIVVFQGVQQLFQSHSRYLAHRSTYESLRSEQALYAAGAGPYRDATDPGILLAERVEEIRGAETMSWVDDETRLLRRSTATTGQDL